MNKYSNMAGTALRTARFMACQTGKALPREIRDAVMELILIDRAIGDMASECGEDAANRLANSHQKAVQAAADVIFSYKKKTEGVAKQITEAQTAKVGGAHQYRSRKTAKGQGNGSRRRKSPVKAKATASV